MATAKPLTLDELCIRAMNLPLEDQIELHRMLVGSINRRRIRERTNAADSLNPGDTVQFNRSGTGELITVTVEKITPSGVVYGRSMVGASWRVSATVCRKVGCTRPVSVPGGLV